MSASAKEVAERLTLASIDFAGTAAKFLTRQGIDVQAIGPSQQARLVLFPHSQEDVPRPIRTFLTRAYGQRMDLIGVGITLVCNQNPLLASCGDYLAGADLLVDGYKNSPHPEADGLIPNPKHGIWLSPVLEVTPEIPPGRSWSEYFIASEAMDFSQTKFEKGGYKSGRVGAQVIESLTSFLSGISIENDQNNEAPLGRILRANMGILLITINHAASPTPPPDPFEVMRKPSLAKL